MDRYPMRIAGERRGDQWEMVRSPFDQAEVGEVAVGGHADMDDAIAAAASAFATMRSLSTHRRVEILEQTARGIEREADALAHLMARESGKPIRFCRGEVARAVVTFSLGAAEARRSSGEVLPVDLEPRAEGRLCLYTRVPRGPVAAISPFNFPLNLVAHKLSPALAVGTSVVLKPPPQAPLTAHRLADILEASGLPAGALNVLHCAPETAQRMVEDDRMKVLSFTGSDAVGWHLASVAGKKKVMLELGGNAPCVLDRGVDFERVLDKLLMGAWGSAGQVCIKIQRILVHRDDFDAFVDRFVAASEAVVCGDPLSEDTVVGPLVERRHVERVLAWIEEAVDAGATIHCGGEAEGNIVRPTVLTRVPPAAKVLTEEVFGPVTIVEPYATFEDALMACNAGRFGLQVGVFTADIGKALAAFRALDYGGVMINDVPTFRVDNFPYGGTKDSGFGREGVRFAMDEMTEEKVLVVQPLP